MVAPNGKTAVRIENLFDRKEMTHAYPQSLFD
ncbi:hypothetical protein EZS27_026422 [termite gut metagenome]|uniref:Uncharacterized protein n=1 Tax=termite gut metagenome TaxID=433724 RepID=A0A5J4QT20_9ZZZZ